MRTVGLISLGCPKNLVDSEIMLGLLEKAGYVIVQNPAEADVLIVNTCGFIEDAKKESVDAILEMAGYKSSKFGVRSSELKPRGKCKKLVVAGCLPQRYKDELAKLMPEVDLFVGTGEYHKIVDILKDDLRTYAFTHLRTPQYIHNSATPRKIATPKHAVYIKIAEGCFHGCSFCIIPKLRGGFRSRPIKDIAAEAKMLVGNGARELNLIAQDTTSYGKDLKSTNLVRLLKELSSIDGDFWIRIMYAYPTSITDESIDTVAETPKVCKYLDIPIQHINDRILAAMRRKEKGRDIRLLIEKLRKKIPGITLRTSLIAGFPGETKSEFNELADFVKEGHFDHLGVFTYSKEEGTSAYRLKDSVPKKEMEKRKNLIMEIQSKVSLKHNKSLVGKQLKVLIDAISPSHHLTISRSCGQAPEIDGLTYVKAPGKVLKVGEFAEVKIDGADEYDLHGILICSCPNTTT